MPAKCTRLVVTVVLLMVATAALGRAQTPATPATPAVYRDAVATYARTGDAALAVRPLLGWDRKSLDVAVADTIARADNDQIEAAAVLHLEIGVAIAGISTPSSAGYFELGTQLIDSLLPVNPDVRRALTPERLNEIAKVRSTWLGVAGSAFVSVNDVFRARPFFVKALRITPKSPGLLTLQGTADEVDGTVFNPDEWENLAQKSRIARERTRFFLSAERLYREALNVDPNYALAQIRLGRVHFLFHNLKQAGEWLEQGRAGAQDPSHQYLAAMFTGALQQEQKDLAGARQSFERALALAPRSQNAFVALAYVDLIAGRPDRAQTLSRSYLGTPNSDEAWWSFKNGTLDHVGLAWLRKRVRK